MNDETRMAAIQIAETEYDDARFDAMRVYEDARQSDDDYTRCMADGIYEVDSVGSPPYSIALKQTT